MKKNIIILVVLFVLLVLMFAPVRLVEGFIPQGNGVSISGLQGSIWSGSIDNVQIKDFSFNNVDYDISFFSLLMGHLGGTAEIHQGDVIGIFDFDIGDRKNIELSDANIKTSASHFERYIPLAGTFLSGELSTQDFQIQIEENIPTAVSGFTRWNRASLDLNGKVWTLGDFEIFWETQHDKKVIVGKINSSKKNILDIDGEFILNSKGLFEYRGSIDSNVDKSIYMAFSIFASGKVKNNRLPIKFKKQLF